MSALTAARGDKLAGNPQNQQAMATVNMYRKFCEVWTHAF